MPFAIDVRRSDREDSHGSWQIAIRAGETVFTRLLRARDNRQDDYILAPPAQLAFWLTDNWWRIRWECIPSAGITPDWRMAHDLSSAGGGYAWPRLAIWGEDERVGLLSRGDPPGVVGPVRYLSNGLEFVQANDFESECDEFLQNTLDAYTPDNADRAAIREQIRTLKNERDDPHFAAWRRMEARLGFDPDDAPDRTIETLERLAERYGQANIEEAATAMPGAASADVLEREIAAARASRVVCEFGGALKAYGVPRYIAANGQLDFPITGFGHIPGIDSADGLAEDDDAAGSFQDDRHSRMPPWKLAEHAAENLRTALGREKGPLHNNALAELLGTTADTFRANSVSSDDGLPYGLRLTSNGDNRNQIALRSRWPHDRRFEVVRALGDAIWTQDGAIGPLAASKTARQKFQRAFAQSLLCPYDDLIAYIGTTQPTEGDIAAAARNFHVSERVVQTVLVNKRVLERGSLDISPYPDPDIRKIEELVDAR
jgi:hypothetical protein